MLDKQCCRREPIMTKADSLFDIDVFQKKFSNLIRILEVDLFSEGGVEWTHTCKFSFGNIKGYRDGQSCLDDISQKVLVDNKEKELLCKIPEEFSHIIEGKNIDYKLHSRSGWFYNGRGEEFLVYVEKGEPLSYFERYDLFERRARKQCTRSKCPVRSPT